MRLDFWQDRPPRSRISPAGNCATSAVEMSGGEMFASQRMFCPSSEALDNLTSVVTAFTDVGCRGVRRGSGHELAARKSERTCASAVDPTTDLHLADLHERDSEQTKGQRLSLVFGTKRFRSLQSIQCGLSQLRVFRLRSLQDRDVGVSIFPEGQEVFVGGESPDAGGVGLRSMHGSRLKSIGTSHA
jgi:hypothetical protein